MAVLWQGAVLFRDRPGELIGQAQGQVWTILDRGGEGPDGSLLVVSTRQVPEGVQYRVLGAPDVRYEATAVEPNLEDGYIWLMNQARAASLP
jgi:hypothetical protein